MSKNLESGLLQASVFFNILVVLQLSLFDIHYAFVEE